MSLIDIVLNDYEITPDVHWAVDMNYDIIFNILDVIRIVNIILN